RVEGAQGRRHHQHRRHRHQGRLARRHQPHVLRRHAVGDGAAAGGDHPRGAVPRHPRGAPGRDPGRHRPRDPAVRGRRALQRGARILRPRHRAGLPRGPAGAALRPPRGRPGPAAGHDLHHRTDDQRGLAPHPPAPGRLDRGHQGPQALGAVGAHGGGHQRRGRDPDPVARRRQRPLNVTAAPDSDVAPHPEGDAAWAAAAAEALRSQDAGFARRFDADEDIERLLMARVIAVDSLVRQAWARTIPADADLTLFAVGGYGRGELFPRSDVDLLVVVGEEACEADTAALSRLFALLWDAGLPVGHAVRTLDECTAAAAGDVTVMTSLIEARPLVAAPEMAARLEDAVSVERVWPAGAFFAAKREELRRRHARFGDTADNLEPNIKEGPGGLRDIQTLRWMARRVFGTRDIESLIPLGHLGLDEYSALEREWRVLARLRYGLHLVARKREERLRFDYQKVLAARLQHVEDADNDRVERMMQEFYRSAAIVLRIGERLLQRFEEQIEGDTEAVPLDAEFAMKRGYLVARDEFWPGGDMARVFWLFALWADHPDAKGLHSRTARALAESLHALPAYHEASAELRGDFIALLRGPGPVRTLERMARLGVLGRWIPAFAKVSGRMQFDLFHVYTVDQHTLAVLRNLASFSTGIPDERFSMAHEVWPLLRKPELLLIAGLFHDIAKGRGGDHSELGAVDARAFCEAHGYGAGDTALVEWLVLKHLLMSVTAQ